MSSCLFPGENLPVIVLGTVYHEGQYRRNNTIVYLPLYFEGLTVIIRTSIYHVLSMSPCGRQG